MNLLTLLTLHPPDLSDLNPGQAGEEWVAYLYRKRGFRILHRNYAVYGRKKLGEIDIICKNRRNLIIVEVKTRRNENFMSVVETVTAQKQKFLRRMSKLFLQANPQYENWALQIDIAAVLLNPVDNSVQSVKLIENAIEDTV